MRHRWVLAALFATALALRLAHLAAVAGFELERAVPGLDRWLEMQIALAVADGDLLGGPLAFYESSPAYALVLGVLYRSSGRTWLGPLVVQGVLGALAPLFLYGVGRRLASPAVGLTTAVLAAFYGPAIFHEGLTVKFALVPVTVSCLLWATSAAACEGSALAAIGAGAAVATLVALRPNAIVVVPVVLAWIAWARPASRAAKAFVLVGAGLLAVGGPLALRRSVVAAREGDTASLWGIHFYIGTSPDGDGGYSVIPGVADDVFGHVDDARALAEAQTGRALEPREVSAYWFARGRELISQRPGDYLALEGRKLTRLLAPGEEDKFGDDYSDYAERSAVLRRGSLTFGAVVPLCLLGLAVAVAQRSPMCWGVALAGAYACSLLVFFVTGRYRLPLAPPLLLCAAVGLVWLAELWRGRWAVALAVTAGLPLAGVALLGARGSDVVWLGVLLGLGLPALARYAFRAGRAGDHPAE